MNDSLSDGYIVGFSLFSVVQLLRIERKTCELQIEGSDGRSGTLAFAGGNLVHAICGDARGEAAVFELLAWENAIIYLRATPPRQTRTIHRPMTQVLMTAVRRTGGDEAASLDEENESGITLPVAHGEEGLLYARPAGTGTLTWPSGWPDSDQTELD